MSVLRLIDTRHHLFRRPVSSRKSVLVHQRTSKTDCISRYAGGLDGFGFVGVTRGRPPMLAAAYSRSLPASQPPPQSISIATQFLYTLRLIACHPPRAAADKMSKEIGETYCPPSYQLVTSVSGLRNQVMKREGGAGVGASPGELVCGMSQTRPCHPSHHHHPPYHFPCRYVQLSLPDLLTLAGAGIATGPGGG